MKKTILALGLFFLMPVTVRTFAQTGTIDSLLKILESSREDTNKLETLSVLSNLFLQNSDRDSALEYANYALSLAKKLNSPKGMANAHSAIGNVFTSEANLPEAISNYTNALKIQEKTGDRPGMARTYANIGNIYSAQGNYSEALKNFLLKEKIFEELGDDKGMARTYSQIGIVYERQGNYPEAMNYYLQALKVFEKAGVQKNIANSYYHLGIINKDMGNYTDALEYHLKGLKLYKQMGDQHSVAASYAEIGRTYFGEGNYVTALAYSLKALEIGEELGDKKFIAACSEEIGINYAEQGDYSAALKYHLQSLEFSEKIGERYNIAETYNYIGRAFERQGKYPQALDSLNKGLSVAKEIGAKNLQKDSYDFLKETYYQMHNLDSTYHYFNLYSEIKDSLLNEEKTKQLAEMQVKYETVKKQDTITQLSLENERKQSQLTLFAKQQQIAELTIQAEHQQRELDSSENERNKQSLLLANNVRKQQQDSIGNLSEKSRLNAQLAISEANKRNGAIVGGIGFAALLSLVFYQLNRRRQTKHSLEINQLNNKVLRTQLNPHFIFNALNSIRSYIQDHAQIADTYLTKFSILMRQVLENSEEEKITLQEEIAMLENYMQLEALRLPFGFDYEIAPDESTDMANTMVPPLILQPMVENAIWHGLKPLNRRGKITLRFTEKNGLLEATVEDNGAGLGSTIVETISTEKKRSMGMQITRERIELLNRKAKAKGWLEQQLFQQGSHAKVVIPVN